MYCNQPSAKNNRLSYKNHVFQIHFQNTEYNLTARNITAQAQ
jgi:hypothetical protein